MAGYICLFRYTQQGIANIKDSPQQMKDARAAAESMGIRTVGLWVTLGKQDVVGVFDAPDDQTMAAFVLGVAKLGNLTSQTMRALSEEEVAQVVAKVS
jgi:uncharacterized protein with GYD domain